MKICRVVGTVVASQDAGRLDGAKYLLVQSSSASGASAGTPMVALDAVQAGEGDLVLVAQGSSCRQLNHTIDRAVDALVIGVIDLVDENGSIVYRTAGGDA